MRELRTQLSRAEAFIHLADETLLPAGSHTAPRATNGVWLSVEPDGAMLKRLFERFTEDARQVIVAAQQESLSLTALESRHRLKAQPGAT